MSRFNNFIITFGFWEFIFSVVCALSGAGVFMLWLFVCYRSHLLKEQQND